MSLNTMVQRLVLEVPGIVTSYAKTLINEALGQIYDTQMWSWQLQESGWLTPGLLFPGGPGTSVGTMTFTPYSTLVIADNASSAAIFAYVNSNPAKLPLITQLQIRSPFYSLYNIVKYEQGGYGQGGYGIGGYGQGGVQLTLDRPWMEPGGAGMSYMIYQAYFPVPVPDFKRFLDARDTTMNAPMNFWSKTQKDLSFEDPQRTVFNLPSYFVPYQTDQRTGSATAGNMMYELWPHPLSVLPYSFGYLRRGPKLINFSDTVPYPLTEECVLWKTKEAAWIWKESQKGEEMQRGAGADYKFLSQVARAQYLLSLKEIKMRDSDLVDLYIDKFRRNRYATTEPYATITGGLNVGRF